MFLSFHLHAFYKNIFIVLLIIFICACSGCSSNTNTDDDEPNDTIPSGLLSSDNIVYLGAFRLPVSAEETPNTFSWGGRAMTHYYNGDPTSSDITPGSLIVAGVDDESPGSEYRSSYYAEVSIPVPVISDDLTSLPTATLLQNFTDLRDDDLYEEDLRFELVKAGIQVLPPQGDQTADTLYMTWGQHIQDEEGPDNCAIDGDASCVPSQTWRVMGDDGELDANQTQGPWWVEDGPLYGVNDYLFDIPENWADEYVGGRLLATGRFRDGGQGSQGPVLIAIGPWLEGNPPAADTTISAVPLLYYSTFPTTTDWLDDYQHPDEWAGGAWLNTTNGAAVIFVGTKGSGANYWYGWQYCPGNYVPCIEPEDIGGPGCFTADGSACNLSDDYYCACDDVSCDEDCHGGRGWWTQEFESQIIFYDPDDFAAVATGTLDSDAPQPYTSMNIDDVLFLATPASATQDYGEDEQRRYRIGAVAYDRTNNLLYVTELLGDEENEQPVVHVWQVGD
ncbi:MAG: hypothetical protein ABII18_08850 [bacterium]